MMSLDLEVIASSFEALRPYEAKVMDLFYSNLFADYPAAKPLFAETDMAKQKKLLFKSLDLCIQKAPKEGALEAYLKPLGARHVGYGAQPEHYDLVGATLVKTLAYVFGENWTAQVEEQWGLFFQIAKSLMVQGAQESLTEKEEVVEIHQPSRSNEKKHLSKEPIFKPVEELSLTELAKHYANEIFSEALEAEITKHLKKHARRRAKEILKQAIEEQAQREIEALKQKAS